MLFRTKSEVVRVMARLEEDQKNLYRVGQKSTNSIKDDQLREIKTSIESLRELKLTIAIKPTEEMIEKIYNWATKNIDPKIILDICVDPKILSGAQVSFEGKFGNYGLQPRWEEYEHGI